MFPFPTLLLQDHLILNEIYVFQYLDECSTEITDLRSSGPIYISSPNYNLGLFYPKNTECVWLFTDNDFGTFIVTVLDFAAYWKDILAISYGDNTSEENQVAILRGTPQPLNFHIPYSKMWIRFTSPSWGATHRGFLLEVYRDTEVGKM